MGTLDFEADWLVVRQDVDDTTTLTLEATKDGAPLDLSGGTWSDTAGLFTVDPTDAATGTLSLTASGKPAGTYPFRLRDTASQVTWLAGELVVGGVAPSRGAAVASGGTVRVAVGDGTVQAAVSVVGGGAGGGGGTASTTVFDPAGTTLAGTDVQTAIEELDTGKATPAQVTAAIDALVAAAPGALDTLDELASALGDDASFATTMTTALAGKSNDGHAHADILETPASVGGEGYETATGVWSHEPPAGRTTGDRVWRFTGADDPGDGVNGIATPGDLRPGDRWYQLGGA